MTPLGHRLGALALAIALLSPVTAEACRGIWICPNELQRLPTEGKAWEALKGRADMDRLPPRLADKDDNADVQAMAMALVFGRTGNVAYREAAIEQILAAMGSEQGGNVLALARNLPGYIIAADIVGLPPEHQQTFRTWLGQLVDMPLDGETLRRVHERRPNNWGTHAGAARLAVARYLDDRAEIDRVARVLRGWVGDPTTHTGFRFGDNSWQADPVFPAGINRAGAERDGRSIDGVLPDDQRRCCDRFTWPPPRENYVYEALQGILAQAVMLSRAGHPDVWDWQDKALLRAFHWLNDVADYPARGDDTWQPHLINRIYGTSFAAPLPTRPGKNVGFTDWTHGPESAVAASH